MPEPFPNSLLTSGPTAGHDLACRLADQIGAASAYPGDMAAHLRTNYAPPGTRDLIVATYFHAITVANRGWSEPRKI